MIELIARTNELAKPWADAMAAVLWQSTILVAAVALVCWALRRHSPAVRYWLWVAVSAKLLLLPFWSVEVAAPAWWSSPAVDRATPPTAFATPQGAIPPTEHKSNIPPIGAAPMRARVANPGPPQPTATVAWQTWLLAVWVIVVLFQGARTIVQLSNLKRLLAGSHPANDGVAMLVADCARQILLVHTPRVRQTDADGSPFVCCMWRPTLLLPAWDSPPLNAAAQRQIVLHELAHIRRGDLWTIWVIHLMRVVYWFHPLAHWISYRANLERELACDQLAMQHSGASAAAYARTLVLAAGRGMQPIVLTAAGAAQLDGGAGGAGRPLALSDASKTRRSSTHVFPQTIRPLDNIAERGTSAAAQRAVEASHGRIAPAAPGAAHAGLAQGAALLVIGLMAAAPLIELLPQQVRAHEQQADEQQADEPPPTNAETKPTATEGDAAPADEGSELLRRLKRAGDSHLEVLRDRDGYALDDSESLKRIPPPFPKTRMDWYRAANPTQYESIPAGPDAMIFRWENGRLHNWGSSFGGYDLDDVLTSAIGIYPQFIEGPEELRQQDLPGDWILRADAAPEQILGELEQILNRELEMRVRLRFDEVEREVYVVRGKYQFKPLPGESGVDETQLIDRVVRSDKIHIYGLEFNPDSGAGGGTGDFKEFCDWLGRWINAPIINEVEEPPAGEVTWRLHEATLGTKPGRELARDALLVLNNITTQTGLAFIPETRPIKVLIVEPIE